MSMPEILDRPPAGWFAFDVIRKDLHKWDWVGFVISVHPDEFKHCRTAPHAWVRIPGKHRNRDAAREALENMIATRH
jgi:hypothetical protein